MSTYSIVIGDTFALISRKKYGTENEASRIASANPGVSEPLVAGVEIIIPVAPDAPQDIQQEGVSDGIDEVALLLKGSRFRFWTDITINRAIDTMDIVEFAAPFDSSDLAARETFRPMSFQDMTVTVGGAPLFTGKMLTPLPVVDPKSKTVAVSGYSLPGVLNDCTPPPAPFQREFNGQDLRGIATTIAAPFGIGVEFQASPGAIFKRVGFNTGQKALAFLTDLAKQRNLIISSTAEGKLLFLQSTDVGQPVARLQQGSSPVMSVEPSFSPQDYYSHITGIEPVVVGLAGSQFTVKNPRLPGVVRPLTYNAPDAQDADIKAATEAKMGRMFGNMVSYSISVATWRDPAGNLWAPNTTLTLLAPDAMIYSEYEFVIRSVAFRRDKTTKTAALNLIIPGGFSGKIPEMLPWEE